jgi:divalent metal cation (Fe/Co/Zn/Cd) transporter
VGDILDSRNNYSDAGEYLVPAAVVGLCALLAAVMIAVSLAVHSVETTLERRREMAALVATGVPVSTVGAAQRTEGLLATLPLTVVGSLAGAVGYGWLGHVSPVAYAGGLLASLLTVLVVAAMVWLAGALVRPWLDTAVDPGNLRTE